MKAKNGRMADYPAVEQILGWVERHQIG